MPRKAIIAAASAALVLSAIIPDVSFAGGWYPGGSSRTHNLNGVRFQSVARIGVCLPCVQGNLLQKSQSNQFQGRMRIR